MDEPTAAEAHLAAAQDRILTLADQAAQPKRRDYKPRHASHPTPQRKDPS